jgi:hypothetical protein
VKAKLYNLGLTLNEFEVATSVSKVATTISTTASFKPSSPSCCCFDKDIFDFVELFNYRGQH